MTPFRHPAFAKVWTKLERAASELQQIEDYASTHAGELASGDWGAVNAVSLGIHDVYNGIEDVLLGLANDVDGFVPRGSALHQDIRDQMSAEVAGVRPALLEPELYRSLGELKGFRHVVRHRYGFDLDAGKVRENLDRLRRSLPAFVDAVKALEAGLTRDDGGPSG
jgi:hypothetical protein